MKTISAIATILAATAAVLLPAPAAAQGVWGPYTAIESKGKTLQTLKHTFSVDASGFPAQIVIKPAAGELPLANRGRRGPSPQQLERLGRGEQLRAPLRLVAVVGGKTVQAQVTAEAKPGASSEGAKAFTSKVKAGPITAEITATYQADGSLLGRIAYRGGAVDSLALVMDLKGVVDIAYPGLPANFDPAKADFQAIRPLLPPTGEVLWENTASTGAARDFVGYLYFGSRDRGFTWLCDSRSGFQLDPKRPMMRLTRDDAGQVTWTAYLVNKPGAVAGVKTAEFALLTHPSRSRPKNARQMQWLNWPGGKLAGVDGLGKTTLAARDRLAKRLAGAKSPADLPLLGGLTAFSLESLGQAIELRGSACAKLLSVDQDLADLYPISLFAVCAGTATGLPARVSPNVGEVTTPGASPPTGRNVLARALLHDVGVDVAGMDQPADFLRVVNILKEFGALSGDGKTEVLPYWRNGDVVRYGEPFDPQDAFALTETNPVARVHVTVYRRPNPEGRGYQAMFVVANESDQDVRERLFIMNPGRLYGRKNELQGTSVWSELDFSKVMAIASENDWAKNKVVSRGEWQALKDLEDGGAVKSNSRRGRRGENYGPLFVPAHGMRIVYARGR